jgi:hypothetical protein
MVISGPKEKIKVLLAWMGNKTKPTNNDELVGFHPANEEKTKLPGDFYTREDTWETILSLKSEEVDFDEGISGIAFEHDSIKAYVPWDELIKEIQEYCTEQDLSFGYGRLGEESDDVDLWDNGKELYVVFARDFGEPFDC